MHTEFRHFYPDLAKDETRSITFLENNPFGVPAGHYVFLELYCTDKGCDCRNVYINVYSLSADKTVATICYGWESLKFYKKWLGPAINDNETVKTFKGPSLPPLTPQTQHASIWLKFFKDMVKNEKKFVDRLISHYKLVKIIVDR